MEIQERTLKFGVKIIKFAEKLPKSHAGDVLARQVIRSGTSIGANMEEADAAASRKDFINKVVIARKEAREARYWLRLIKEAELIHHEKNLDALKELIDEAYELMRILSSIINKARK